MQFNIQNLLKFGPLTLAAALATACSNGSNNSTPPPSNVAPIVSADNDRSVDEKVSVTIGATASDSDGTISAYSWTQTAGTSVDLTGANTASIEFVAPVAKAEQTLSFEITVTDDDGATASDMVSVTVMPVNEIDFQMQGLVWNGAAVPANVTADFGGDPIVVTTDNDGNYTINIAADEDAGASLLFLRSEATSDPEIAFHNIPLTLQSLMDASGGDGVLDVSDEFGVNLTPLSTAFYGAMYRENDSVATEADVTEAMARVNGGPTVTLGSILKIISENNAGVQDGSSFLSDMHLGLPDGYDDTIDFAIDPLAVQQYVTTLRALEPTTLENAKVSMLGDENIVSDITDPFSVFPTTITMAEEDVVVSRLTVNADGTGVFTEGGSEYDVEWSQDGSGIITITGTSGSAVRETESFPWKQVNGSFMQVREVNSLNQIVLTPQLELPTGKLYQHLNDITLSYPDNSGDLPNEDITRSFDVTYIEDSDYQDLDLDALFGGNSQIEILTSYFSDSFNPNLGPDTNTGFGAHQFHYNADVLTLERTGTATNGTVTTEFGSDLFNNGAWEAVDPKTLRITFDSDRFNPGETFEIDYALINDNLATSSVRREGNLEGLHNGVFAVKDTAQAPQSNADAEGFYAIPIGINTSQVFWTELKTGGDAETMTLIDQDNDGILEQNEARIASAFWTLNADGTVEVSEYRFPNTRAPNCDPNVTTCVLSRRSKWTIANRRGMEAFTLNELSIYFPDRDDSSLPVESWYQTTARSYDVTATAPVDISALPPG